MTAVFHGLIGLGFVGIALFGGVWLFGRVALAMLTVFVEMGRDIARGFAGARDLLLRAARRAKSA